MPKFTEYLLITDRRAVKLIVGLLNGHYRLSKHVSNVGPTKMLCTESVREKKRPRCTFFVNTRD